MREAMVTSVLTTLIISYNALPTKYNLGKWGQDS